MERQCLLSLNGRIKKEIENLKLILQKTNLSDPNEITEVILSINLTEKRLRCYLSQFFS